MNVVRDFNLVPILCVIASPFPLVIASEAKQYLQLNTKCLDVKYSMAREVAIPLRVRGIKGVIFITPPPAKPWLACWSHTASRRAGLAPLILRGELLGKLVKSACSSGKNRLVLRILTFEFVQFLHFELSFLFLILYF
jgi:hypothetical protein